MSGYLLRSFFEPLVLKTADAVQRFPLSIMLCCAAYAGMASGLFKPEPEIIYQLILAFFWSVTARLLADSHGFKENIYLAIGVIGYLILGGWTHYLYVEKDHYSGAISTIFIFATMFILPFISRSKTDTDFWNFNYAFWTLLIFGFFLSVIFYLSGAAILQILKIMTGFKMPFEGLFMLTAFLFGPIFVLSNLPKNLSEPPQSERILTAQCNIQAYFIIPLFLIYSLIFYIYSGSMIVKWELPKGELAYYVMGFSLVGLVCYFSNFGFASSKPVLGFFRKNFFYLLSLPLILLALAIYQRIGAYGITEDRYSLILLCLFLATSLGVHFSKYRLQELRIIPCILLIFLAIASIGPLSAVNISNHSQMARLEVLIEKYNLVSGGKFTPPVKALSFEDQRDLSSLLQYFTKPGKKKLLAKWTTDSEYLSSHQILEKMKIEFINPYSRNPATSNLPLGEIVTYSRKREMGQFAISVKGYQYFVDNISLGDDWKERLIKLDSKDKAGPGFVILLQEDKVIIKKQGKAMTLDLGKIIQERPPNEKDLSINSSSAWADAKFDIDNFRAQYVGNQIQIKNMSGKLFIDFK